MRAAASVIALGACAISSVSAKGNTFFAWKGIVPSAAWGYGRFPCSAVHANGSFYGNASACAAGAMKRESKRRCRRCCTRSSLTSLMKYFDALVPGTGAGNDEGNQGDGVKPILPQCSRFGRSGAYFCGTARARCKTDANCDNGSCKDGRCGGGFGYKCNGGDTVCSGYLYCNAQDFSRTAAGTCGGIGSFCQDYTLGSKNYTAEQNFMIFNQNCASNYCNTNTGNCDTRRGLGESCRSDPDFACVDGLVCKSHVCAKAAAGETKARRSFHVGKRSTLCNGGTDCAAEMSLL
ncbi:BQ2448_366 [Microbotryum intermedium]|uniref:BQ2448_366 protein n=1 Tax=Microbotryum intermedium TaxID=269621 RepID=A0A238F5C1_9BASI|nr:BQ2448_366 [Microbotryum intermedium]